MIKKQHLVTTGIITVLLATNGVVGYNYYQDTKSLTGQLNVEKKNVVELKNEKYKLNSLVDKQQSEIIELENDNKKLNKTIDEKDKVIKKQNKSIDNLKRKLKNNNSQHNAP